MFITNIYQAKTQFSKMIELVIAGRDVVIAKAGKPVAKLVAYSPILKKRVAGRLKGKISMTEDFTAESKDVNRLFYGTFYQS